jgi:hypothetical protein
MAKRAGPARPGPGPVKPGQNRAGPAEPTGLSFCSSPARSGPKRAGPARLARKNGPKSGLNGPCRASPPCLVPCPSPPAYSTVPGSDRAQKAGFVPGSRASCFFWPSIVCTNQPTHPRREGCAQCKADMILLVACCARAAGGAVQ